MRTETASLTLILHSKTAHHRLFLFSVLNQRIKRSPESLICIVAWHWNLYPWLFCIMPHLFYPAPISQPSPSRWNERLVVSSGPDEFSNPSVSIDRQVKARAIALVMGRDSKWSHPFVCSVCMLLVEVGYCSNANNGAANVLGHVCVLCTGAWPSGRER